MEPSIHSSNMHDMPRHRCKPTVQKMHTLDASMLLAEVGGTMHQQSTNLSRMSSHAVQTVHPYGETTLSPVSTKKMNIEIFAKHIASRKVQPIAIELKESKIEIPPEYNQVELRVNKNKARGACSLQEATVVSCDMEGDRQWISLSFKNEYEDPDFLKWFNDLATSLSAEIKINDTDADTDADTRTTLLLSRFRKDYTGKDKVPIRLWKMDREGVLQEYDGCLTAGSVVICSFEEMRAYCKKGTDEVKVAADLHRDILVVRKSNKRRRLVEYFSDGE